MTLLIALTLASPASQFTTERSVEELAVESRAVVQGTVTEASTVPAPVGLVTRYTVTTHTCLLGPCEETVTVLLPGGRLDGLEQRFADVPLWRAGDEVVVFVPPVGEPVRFQGVFTVHGDEIVDPLQRRDGLVPRFVERLESRLAPVRP